MRGLVAHATAIRHRYLRAATLSLLCLLPAVPRAASLYLCKAYGGGSFWSVEPCQGKQALVDRMVSVPDGLPFREQVRLGEQARAEGDRLRQPDVGGANPAAASRHKPAHRADQHVDKAARCAAIESRVNKLDAQARQAQSARAQDGIAAHKRRLREQQAELHC